MIDYNSKTVTGNSWQRTHTITAFNPHGGAPYVVFAEEVIVDMGNGDVVHKPVSDTLLLSYDPALVVPLIDPATGALTGQTFTGAQLFDMLYSLYLSAATKRDQAAAAPPA